MIKGWDGFVGGSRLKSQWRQKWKKEKKITYKKITILIVFEIMLYSICIASIAHNRKLVQNGSTKSLDVYIYKQIHVGT